MCVTCLQSREIQRQDCFKHFFLHFFEITLLHGQMYIYTFTKHRQNHQFRHENHILQFPVQDLKI